MKSPSLFAHLRDILILPFTVTVIVPYLIYDCEPGIIPDAILVKIIGGLTMAAGLSLFLYTVFLFRTRGEGTLAPWSPTQRLVITGPYQYCRNPMITGVFFILIGESLVFQEDTILVWAAIFFCINTVYFIAVEEPSLLRRFGDDYVVYKRNVPRWLPRFSPFKFD